MVEGRKHIAKLVVAVAAAAIFGVVLSACGDDENPGNIGPNGGGDGDGGGLGDRSTTNGDGGDGGTTTPPIACVPASEGAPKFHVAVDGKPDGDGSAQKPWDLATAFKHPAAVKPGDTIWLRGGTYVGGWVAKLVGAMGAPITVRSYPGEWAVLDGTGTTEPGLQIYKSWATFRDLEIVNSTATRVAVSRPSGIYVEGANVKLINLVVHDVGTGIICNSATTTTPELAPELEIYGCLLYDNGWEDAARGHGHHLYLQNRDGTKYIKDNLIAYAFGFGVHAYSDNDSHFAQGYELVGNVWWGNGAATAGVSKLYDGCMVGHNGTLPVKRLTLKENMGWAPGFERDVRLGWSAANEDATLEANYFVGETVFQAGWQTLAITNNTFVGPVQGITTSQYPNNTYLTARPKEPKVFVRKNDYQPGRANIVVYNYALADAIDVDVASIIAPGARWELRNAQDYLKGPIANGVYAGGTIKVPMAGLTVAQPIGMPNAILPEETPGKELGVFVLTSECK